MNQTMIGYHFSGFSNNSSLTVPETKSLSRTARGRPRHESDLIRLRANRRRGGSRGPAGQRRHRARSGGHGICSTIALAGGASHQGTERLLRETSCLLPPSVARPSVADHASKGRQARRPGITRVAVCGRFSGCGHQNHDNAVRGIQADAHTRGNPGDPSLRGVHHTGNPIRGPIAAWIRGPPMSRPFGNTRGTSAQRVGHLADQDLARSALIGNIQDVATGQPTLPHGQ